MSPYKNELNRHNVAEKNATRSSVEGVLASAAFLWQAYDDVGWKKRFLFKRAIGKLGRES